LPPSFAGPAYLERLATLGDLGSLGNLAGGDSLAQLLQSGNADLQQLGLVSGSLQQLLVMDQQQQVAQQQAAAPAAGGTRGQQAGRLQRLGSGLESIEMALPGGEVRQAYEDFRGQAEHQEQQQEQQEFDLHGGR
jgi:hypothetical protein